MKRIAICMLIAGVMAVATPASAGVIFQQDFSAGGVPGDYIDAGAGPANTTDFTLMQADAGAGTFAISSNALTLERESAVRFEVNQLARSDMDGGRLMRMVWDMKIESDAYGENGTSLVVGATPLNHWSREFVSLTFSGSWGQTFTMSQSGGSTSAAYTIGSNEQWSIFANNTDSSESYTAPDASTSSVAARSFDLWIGDTVFFNDEPGRSEFVTDITSFKMSLVKHDDALWTFDNFEIRNDLIPEPATMVLLAMGGVGMLLRRRRA